MKKYHYALLSGGFDPVHVGHLAMIKEAKKIAEKVIILLNSDKWLLRKKGKPFMIESQRAQILEEFGSISKVIIQNNDDDDSSNNAIISFTKENIGKSICYCNGGDRSDKKKIREAETCHKYGVDLIFGVGGVHKLESSSDLTKNYLSDVEKRPWGNFHIIAKGNGYQIKEMNVNPNNKLSLQKHKHRSEYWQVIDGEGKVMLEDSDIKLKAGDNIFIPKGSLHRLENTQTQNLKIIEIQIGNILSEEDIERLEDDYGRV